MNRAELEVHYDIQRRALFIGFWQGLTTDKRREKAKEDEPYPPFTKKVISKKIKLLPG